MPQFHVIRHAQSNNNALQLQLAKAYNHQSRYIRPIIYRNRHHDAALTDIGYKQAEHLIAPLLTLCRGKTLIAVSPMLRAIQTIKPSLAHVLKKDISLVCHGLLYEVGGCYHLKEARPGLSRDEIAKFFPEQLHIPKDGWFAQRTERETRVELAERVNEVVLWLESLVAAETFDTVILISHGAFMARLLRKILSMPEDIWLCHANTGLSSFRWDKRQGFLLQSINSTAHIAPELQTGASQADGWWPAVYKKEYAMMSFEDVPHRYPQLYTEICGYVQKDAEDSQKIYFCAFHHTELLGLISYHQGTSLLSPMITVDETWQGQDKLHEFAKAFLRDELQSK